MQSSLKTSVCGNEIPIGSSRKAYVLIRYPRLMDGIKKFERLESTLVKTYGAWDAIAEIPIATPYRLPDSREVTGLQRLEYTLGSIRNDPEFKRDVDNTYTLIGAGPAPYRETIPGNYKAYTLLNPSDGTDLQERLRQLFNELPEITFATLAYGGWGVVIESQHTEYEGFLETSGEIRRKIPPANAENVATLIGIERQGKSRF